MPGGRGPGPRERDDERREGAARAEPVGAEEARAAARRERADEHRAEQRDAVPAGADVRARVRAARGERRREDDAED